jgi:hypothetical protein
VIAQLADGTGVDAEVLNFTSRKPHGFQGVSCGSSVTLKELAEEFDTLFE